MTKEEKESLEQEIENTKKAVSAVEWQYKYIQSKASVLSGKGNMDALIQITRQRDATKDYLKWLEGQNKNEVQDKKS